MARASRSVDLQIKGDARALHLAINAIPKAAQKEARVALNQIEKMAQKAAASVDKVTKNTGPSMKDAKEGIDGVKTALESLGIAGSGAADGAQKAIDAAMKLTAAGGPAGLAIGAAAAAVLAFGAAGVMAALQSSDLIKELDAMGRADGITADQRAAVGAMDVALREAKIATQELTIAFGAEFAPAVQMGASAVGELARGLVTLVEVSGQAADATEGLRRAVTAVTSLGLSEVYRATADDGAAAATQIYAVEQGVRDQAKAVAELVAEQTEWAKMDAEIAKAQAEGDKAREDSARRAQARMAAEAAAQADRVKTIEEHFAAEARFAAEDVALMQERAKTAAATDAAMAASAEAHLRQVAEVRAQLDAEADARANAGAAALQSQIEALPATFATLASLIADQAEAQSERAAAELMTERQKQKQLLDAQLRRGEIDDAQHATRLDQLRTETRAERRAIRERENNRKQAAKTAFGLYKAGAIAQALADGAKATVALLASPPIAALGPGAPLAAAGIALPATAVQIGVIAAQKAFHTGGMVSDYSRGPDEVPALLRQGEGVLTPRGVQAAGGPAGVASMNQGNAGMGVPSQITINLTMPDGTIATASGTMDAGGTVYAALRSAPGRRPIGAR